MMNKKTGFELITIQKFLFSIILAFNFRLR